MICKNYIVTGEDVNDIMVMENAAYISYTIRLLYRFLYDNGFSKEKLVSQHIGLLEGNDMLVLYKNLMFTELFYVKLDHCIVGDVIKIESSFFNSKNECCAKVNKQVQWFDFSQREVVKIPIKVRKHFNSAAIF